jgi:hypothetical protein
LLDFVDSVIDSGLEQFVVPVAFRRAVRNVERATFLLRRVLVTKLEPLQFESSNEFKRPGNDGAGYDVNPNPVAELVSESPQTPSGPKLGVGRKKPEGGDALTPLVWEVCYDLYEANQKVTPLPVMTELKGRAGTAGCPVLADVAGGVKYEDSSGNEHELNMGRLENRIREWKKACLSPNTRG